MSRQERHDEAAGQAVANQPLQMQQNEARDVRDVEFQAPAFRGDPWPPHGGYRERQPRASSGHPGPSSRHAEGGPRSPEHDPSARRGRSAAVCREQPSPVQPIPA
uniref:Uncharacterized protein n=1 Tax=Ixodes ricinus TaxID=34613 RepID=A0A6B0UG97_IXORI